MASYPESNRTYQIIHAARKGNYPICGVCVYNTDGVLATIRAAEATRSPAMIQFFPWTLHHHGGAFVAFAAAAARAASVPISIHLDHCTSAADAVLALDMAFDSIMVDGSLGGAADNAAYVRGVVARARERNVTVEAELGRIEGGYEDVLAVAAGQGVLTEPAAAARFVAETGVEFLAPCFGNVHGAYPEGGPERWWQMERLAGIREAVGEGCPLVMHGLDVEDDMLERIVKAGFGKINVNKRVRLRYGEYLKENAGRVELTELQEKGVEIYAQDIAWMMKVCGSDGKA